MLEDFEPLMSFLTILSNAKCSVYSFMYLDNHYLFYFQCPDVDLFDSVSNELSLKCGFRQTYLDLSNPSHCRFEAYL